LRFVAGCGVDSGTYLDGTGTGGRVGSRPDPMTDVAAIKTEPYRREWRVVHYDAGGVAVWRSAGVAVAVAVALAGRQRRQMGLEAEDKGGQHESGGKGER